MGDARICYLEAHNHDAALVHTVMHLTVSNIDRVFIIRNKIIYMFIKLK